MAAGQLLGKSRHSASRACWAIHLDFGEDEGAKEVIPRGRFSPVRAVDQCPLTFTQLSEWTRPDEAMQPTLTAGGGNMLYGARGLHRSSGSVDAAINIRPLTSVTAAVFGRVPHILEAFDPQNATSKWLLGVMGFMVASFLLSPSAAESR